MTTKPSAPPENLVVAAINLLGSEAKLAAAVGVSQAAINKAKNRVADGHRVSAELATGIERATDGAVRRSDLRPDLFASEPAEAAA